MGFARSALGQFLATPAGRVVRIVAGFVLICLGYFLGGATAVILMIVGLVPLVAGVLDLCFISALLGGPLTGAHVRELKSQT
jgi:Inner membrane protein YgaP-like, transmembrane domain